MAAYATGRLVLSGNLMRLVWTAIALPSDVGWNRMRDMHLAISICYLPLSATHANSGQGAEGYITESRRLPSLGFAHGEPQRLAPQHRDELVAEIS